jgi:hypothetical protein
MTYCVVIRQSIGEPDGYGRQSWRDIADVQFDYLDPANLIRAALDNAEATKLATGQMLVDLLVGGEGVEA